MEFEQASWDNSGIPFEGRAKPYPPETTLKPKAFAFLSGFSGRGLSRMRAQRRRNLASIISQRKRALGFYELGMEFGDRFSSL